MKLTTNAKDMLDALNKVAPAVGKLEVLACVKLSLFSNRLTLCCTDNEICLKTAITLDGNNEDGEICFSLKTLVDTLKKVDQEKPVNIKTIENNKVVVSSGRFRSTVQYLDADLFPEINTVDNNVLTAIFKKTDLYQLAENTKYSVDVGSYRVFLRGVNVRFSKGLAEFIASNGHLMAYCKATVDNDIEYDIIIPKKTLEIISGMTKTAEQEIITMNVSSNSISLDIDDTTLVSVLVDAKYPNVAQIINFAPTVSFSVYNDEFVKAIKRVAITSNKNSQAVMLNVKNGEIRLSTMNSQHDESEDFISLPTNTSAEYSSAFSAEYLLYVLSMLHTEKVCFFGSPSVNNCKISGYDETTFKSNIDQLGDNEPLYVISRIVV